MNTAQAEPYEDPPWAEEADDAVQQVIDFIPLLYHYSLPWCLYVQTSREIYTRSCDIGNCLYDYTVLYLVIHDNTIKLYKLRIDSLSNLKTNSSLLKQLTTNLSSSLLIQKNRLSVSIDYGKTKQATQIYYSQGPVCLAVTRLHNLKNQP